MKAAANIRNHLAETAIGGFPTPAAELLAEMGYHSDRTMPGQSGDAADFLAQFPAENPDTQSEQVFRNHVKSVHLLFQLTDTEIGTAAQGTLFDSDAFAQSNARSFLFIAVELEHVRYPRGRYAAFTREINKRLSQPAVVLFRTASNLLTLAFVHRRPHKRDDSRDVLGSVSLVREIDPANPHRAHLDILAELSLDERLAWMETHGKPVNFDGLLAAWLDALDTEELNRRFYRELSAWFERAGKKATFPTDEATTLLPEEHLIRLITRLLFVWFMKEKGLVAGDLFVEARVNDLLKDYDRDSGDAYYRTVLQNLFFATLNTEIAQRRFSRKNNADHRNFSVYRYQETMRHPNALRALFDQTPFINGGLFDCLDSFQATWADGVRIDCFSDTHFHKLSIPNRLFFDEDGLIPLFNRYKFTVEENTPVEQEVALDPELLGKVFENLLAAYNPETRETARKQTGSYYTPRQVVDYMVDEALVASLAQKCRPTDGDPTFWQDRLRYLLDYADAFNDAHDLFNADETAGLVRAIAELKVLDPAVGSGAFPMGVLHKLNLALNRLDRHNERWEELQKERAIRRAATAFDAPTQQQRDTELDEISETFEKYRDSDFGRKLYLMQNSIFGVDIQPVACQIAKLRFFISLAIEQEADPTEANFGIKPLPNLETRFIAADTLIGLRLSEAGPLLQNDAVQQKRKAIEAIRERYFLANNRRTKRDLDRREKEHRDQLERVLEELGAEWAAYQQQEIERKVALLRTPEQRRQVRAAEEKQYRVRQQAFDAGLEDARKIARWDPYNQNAKADWFDAEYMFGVDGGFDVVIGNPPYVRADSGARHLDMRQRIEASQQYETLWEKWDLYVPFIERGYKLLTPGGFATMIVSDAYCHSKYAQKSRNWFLKNSRILRLDFFSKIQVFDAAVRNVTYLFQKADGRHHKPQRRVHEPEFGVVKLLPTDEQRNLTHRVFFPEDTEVQQFSAPTVTLDEICYISVGMVVHADEKRAPGAFELRDLVSDTRDACHPKPFVEGKHLARWLPATNKWLEWGTERAPGLFRRPTFSEIYDVNEKVLVQRSPGPNPKTCYDDFRLHFTESSVGFIPWHSLAGVRNRSIKKQTRYRDEKPQRPDLPQREDLEKTSRRFAVKFLLGVMNSTAARDFLRANRRSNIHLYPDDWKKLPIPDVTPEQQAPVVELVDQILAAKRTDPKADIASLEAKIDQLIHELYGVPAEAVHDSGHTIPQEPGKRSILELRGLGKEIWEGVDAQAYVEGLRKEWDPRR